MSWATLLKYGLPVLAVLALIAGVLWYIDDVRDEGKEVGKIETEHQVQQNTIIIQKEITRAEQAKPRTRRSVADSLRDGSF